MVAYVGGKRRNAKRIRDAILPRIGQRTRLVEPFLGGGAACEVLAPHFSDVYASDLQEDLILMWQALQAGWEPELPVTKEEHKALKYAEPSARRGFAGFACSFSGKWFAGHKHLSWDAKYRGGTWRDMQQESVRSLQRQLEGFGHATIVRADYRDSIVYADTVVYADPPYADTTEYGGVPAFDSTAFWEWADDCVERHDAAVFVSEYTAPDHWEEVWSRRMGTYGLAEAATERLYARVSETEAGGYCTAGLHDICAPESRADGEGGGWVCVACRDARVEIEAADEAHRRARRARYAATGRG